MDNSTAIYDGSSGRYGAYHDIIRIRPTSVIVTEDETTPDFLRPLLMDTISEPGSTLIRPDRAMIDFDQGFVTQTLRRVTRPREYTFQDATLLPEELREADPDNDGVQMPGLNARGIGAIARWQDVFRISISPGKDDELPKTWNDRFGKVVTADDKSFGDDADESDTEDLWAGRLEIRTFAHYYQDDIRTGPINFFPGTFPEDEPGVPTVPEQENTRVVGEELLGEWIPGRMMYHPSIRAWMPVTVISSWPCDLATPVGSLETIDERIASFVSFACPTAGFGGINCTFPAGCGFLPCDEIGAQNFQERFVTLTDRINCILHEIDRIYCLFRCVNGKIDSAKLATGGEPTVTGDCCTIPAFPPS